MTTATDVQFQRELAQRLGPRFRDQRDEAAFIEGEGRQPARAGVARPAGARLRAYAVHHSAGSASASPASIWRYHVQTRRWSTGGYHAIIAGDGVLHLMADPSRMTYGAGPAWNASTVHVCLLGNFEQAPPTAQQLETLWTWLCTCDDVLGYLPWRPHRALKATACPGRLLVPHVEAMARRGALKPRPTHYGR